MKFRIEFAAILIFLAALYAAYFFIRHSYIIVGLAPVLGVLVLAMILAFLVAVVGLRRRS